MLPKLLNLFAIKLAKLASVARLLTFLACYWRLVNLDKFIVLRKISSSKAPINLAFYVH
ncbi:hypothetical protein [Campylobacter concisus]|uniref:hypothetical protein n=1 Tax=Campylobacter concisus TaxID=199 RepID=UPI0015D67278|nr:hypothetical protein [Campylobacter concisus]